MRKLTYITAISLAMTACGNDSSTTTASDDSSDSTYVGGTANASEREAYSHDIYDKPEGLTGEQKDRYENLPPEGQEYVDEKMKQYDEFCSTSTEC